MRGAEKATAVLRPGALTRLVSAAGRRQCVAAFEFGGQRVMRGRGRRRWSRPLSFPACLDRRCSCGQHGKADRADPYPACDVARPHGSVKHRDIGWLVAGAWRQETLQLRLTLILTSSHLGALQALGAALSREERGHVGKLLRDQGEQLVASLLRLQCTGGTLARRDERVHLRLRRIQIADDGCLRLQRVLEAGERVLPPCLRVGDELPRRRRPGVAGRVEALELALDVGNVVGDALRLAEQLLRALNCGVSCESAEYGRLVRLRAWLISICASFCNESTSLLICCNSRAAVSTFWLKLVASNTAHCADAGAGDNGSKCQSR